MASSRITRRQFVGGSLAGLLVAGSRPEARVTSPRGETAYRLYWGDLHNHNAVGYAKGSLERSIELARAHLDFFSFTGHASWHDIPEMPKGRHRKWLDGFEVHSDHWPKTRRLIREANTGDFVALLGYEWHSSRFGDYCMIFPGDERELFLPDHVDKLLDFAEAKKALAIPHHVGYAQGWRGANWKHFRPGVSPVVEVFSEHGCTETDRSPYPMIRHSLGGRSTSNTIEYQMKRGLRFGFVASSDDHRGYPGAYGEGVVGVWARELTSDSLFEAIRARRTYAATGDRITLDVRMNGQPMGTRLEGTADREIDIRVEGQDSIHMIELVRNGRVIERFFPEDHAEERPPLPGRVKCRVRYGWGPWAALDLGRVCHWDFRIVLENGKIHRAWPCYQSAPFDETLRDRLEVISEKELHLRSNTTREKCYAEDPTKSVVLDLEAGAETTLELRLERPARQTVRARLVDLIDDNVVTFTGEFTSESVIIERVVGPSEYAATVRMQDRRSPDLGPDGYYVRVTQHNGQIAWSSPIWVG